MVNAKRIVRVRVVLDTQTQFNNFVKLCGSYNFPIYLSDGTSDFRVSAKSTLGCILSKALWKHPVCVFEADETCDLEHKLRQLNLTEY